MTDLTPRLTHLGDQLERAARRDLRPHRPRRRRRRIALAAVAALVVVPGAAVAGYELISEGEVAHSLPAGTLALAGTEPDCTVVRENVEYHCVLARPPAPEVDDWKGTVEPTVDASKHVNGGCRSENSEGTAWQCYIGEEAVRQQIIGPDFLGEYAPSPGQG
jgi:hypothetical protein